MRVIRTLGEEILCTFQAQHRQIEEWSETLSAYSFDPSKEDDPYAWLVCVLALQAVDRGNFGIGSLLLDGKGKIVEMAHNEVLEPYYRSDLHAEMLVMNRFEENHKARRILGTFTLYTSLESCPMCLTRLLGSGVGRVLYVSEDSYGGMVNRIEQMPPVWKRMAKNQVHGKADCNGFLTRAGDGILNIMLEERLQKMEERFG